MKYSQAIRPKRGNAIVMVGTTKGAFLLTANGARKEWQVSGPHLPGHVAYAAAFDARQGRSRVWVSSFHWAYGTTLRTSDDFGQTWTNPESHPIKFPDDAGQALKQIWQIAIGSENEPDTKRREVLGAADARPAAARRLRDRAARRDGKRPARPRRNLRRHA